MNAGPACSHVEYEAGGWGSFSSLFISFQEASCTRAEDIHRMVTEDAVFIFFVILLYLHSAGSICFLVLFAVCMFYVTITNKLKFLHIYHCIAIVMETVMFITCAVYNFSLFFDITKYGLNKPLFSFFAMFVQSYVINYGAATSTYTTLILVQSNYSKSLHCTVAGLQKYFLPCATAYILVVSCIFAPIEGWYKATKEEMLVIKYLSTLPPCCVCFGCMLYYIVRILQSQKALEEIGMENIGYRSSDKDKKCTKARCKKINNEVKYLYICLIEIICFLLFKLTETTVLSPIGYNFILTITAVLFIHICVFVLAYYFISTFIKKGWYDITSRLHMRKYDDKEKKQSVINADIKTMDKVELELIN